MSALLILGIASVLQGAGVTHAQAAQYGLFNTGIDVNAMDVDQHYSVAYSPTGLAGTFGTASPTYKTDLTHLPYQPGDNATSAFISPQPSYAAGQVDAPGYWDYSTTFDLTGVNLSTISLTGQFESDDFVSSIIVNGTPIDITGYNISYTGFSAPVNLTSALVAGMNKIELVVFNFPTTTNTDPTTVRAEYTFVPEPSVWTAVAGGSGLLLLTGYVRRRRAAASV